MPIRGLPVVGYLEQSISTAMVKALTAVGKFKPKYPFKDIETSASDFVALHLKGTYISHQANNPKSEEWLRKSYKKRLEQYMERCELMQYLTKETKSAQSATYLDADRQFKIGMEKFLKLGSQS